MKNKNMNSNNKPMFFLFTCVKNGRQYINKLFDSLLSQTHINFVHYIYEDGSDDPLGELVDSYVERASKLKTPFKVIYEKNDTNIGLNMATKHCIEKCDNLYFIWIDCDNWVDKNFFYNLEKCAKNNNYPLLLRTINFKIYQNSDGHLSKTKKTINKKSFNSSIARFAFYFENTTPYHYSFFAVKCSEYLKLSQNNIIDNKIYFNDEQVLSYCYLFSSNKFAVSKKSFGYQLVYNESLSKLSTSIFKNEIYEIKKDARLNLFKLLNASEYETISLNYELDRMMKSTYYFYTQSKYDEMYRSLREAICYSRDNNLNYRLFIPFFQKIKLILVYKFKFLQNILKIIRKKRNK